MQGLKEGLIHEDDTVKVCFIEPDDQKHPAILRIEGEIDCHNCNSVINWIHASLANKAIIAKQGLVTDFAQLTYIDFQSLMSLLNELYNINGADEMAMVCTGTIKRILTHLDSINQLHVCDNAEEATLLLEHKH